MVWLVFMFFGECVVVVIDVMKWFLDFREFFVRDLGLY